MNSIIVFISNWILVPVFFLALIAPVIISTAIKFEEYTWRVLIGLLVSILLSGIIIYLDLKYGFLRVGSNSGSANLSWWGILSGLILGIIFFILYLILFVYSIIEKTGYLIEAISLIISVLSGYSFFSQRYLDTYFSKYFPSFTAGFVIALIVVTILGILSPRQSLPFSSKRIRANYGESLEMDYRWPELKMSSRSKWEFERESSWESVRESKWDRELKDEHYGMSVDSTVDAPSPDNKEENAPVEEVFFTAYHPKEGSVESWHTLLVYTHLLSVLAKVQEDAQRFDDQIKTPKETTSKSSTPIARGTELTIVPSCEGITFNPERVSFKWVEDFHRADFRFKADKSLSGDAAKGSIDIYVGPLIIGTLKFAMLFNEQDTQSVPEHEESAKMYGDDDIFISYSRKDSEVAHTFKTVLESTGLDVFLDVDDIRSGQLWKKELERRIERAKIFQIFWSANYSQSENCKQEWKYALKQNKGEGYIRPVFWKKPLSPNPPKELNKFNFKYVELKMPDSR